MTEDSEQTDRIDRLGRREEGAAESGDCPACAALTRREALRLGAAAGAAALAGGVVRALPAAAEADGEGLTEDDHGPPPRRITPRYAPNPAAPPPPLVTRAQWGANEAIREGGQEYESTIEKIIVHHTVTPNNPPDPAASVRGVYQYAVSGQWIDMPYHWLIDHLGNLYEGRWARDYPPGVPHTGESASGRNVRGGHALNHNSRTIGIAMLGTYTTTMPPAASIETLVAALTWKCMRWGIDPFGATPYTNALGETKVIANICGHRDTKPTACPGEPLWRELPDIRARVGARFRQGTTGYWIAGRDGRTIAFGDLPDQGDTQRLGLGARVVGIAGHPNGKGYWLFGADGGVFTFGAAGFHGSTGALRLTRPIVGMAVTPTGRGYWLAGADGGVFAFGDAPYLGSMGGRSLNQPVIGICATPSGRGYWLLAQDGGVFSFGDARFRGSTGGMLLSRPIVGMAATPTGRGYWLVGSDGGVFSFGDAEYRGSAASRRLVSPVVGIAPTASGRGYVLLLRDGGVFTYGDAPFFGSAAGGVGEAVGIAAKLPAG